MKANSRRGSILIVSLWALSAFSVMLSGVAFQAGQQAVLLKRESGDFDSRVDFISGLNLFSEIVAQDPEPGEDSLRDEWAGKIKLPEPWVSRLEINVRDEESKINLNTAGQALLEELFKAVSQAQGKPLEGNARDFAAAVLKGRSKGPLASFEELYLLKKIRRADLERLRPYVTVYSGFAGININTAERRVLEVFIRSLSGDEYAKEDLIRALLDYRAGAEEGTGTGYLVSSQLAPQEFLAALKLSATVQRVQMTSQLLPYVTTDSRNWELEMKTGAGRRAVAVVREQRQGEKTRVMNWREF